MPLSTSGWSSGADTSNSEGLPDKSVQWVAENGPGVAGMLAVSAYAIRKGQGPVRACGGVVGVAGRDV